MKWINLQFHAKTRHKTNTYKTQILSLTYKNTNRHKTVQKKKGTKEKERKWLSGLKKGRSVWAKFIVRISSHWWNDREKENVLLSSYNWQTVK